MDLLGGFAGFRGLCAGGHGNGGGGRRALDESSAVVICHGGTILSWMEVGRKAHAPPSRRQLSCMQGQLDLLSGLIEDRSIRNGAPGWGPCARLSAREPGRPPSPRAAIRLWRLRWT